MASYHIPDEPRPGALAAAVVEPFWPLLAIMFAGSWLSWPWFVLNAHAVGSPTRWRQTLVALAGFAATLLAVFVVLLIANASGGDALAVRLAVLGVTAWKLGVSYALLVMQEPSVALHQYYRGIVRSGMLVVIAGWFLQSRLLAPLPAWLHLVLR